MLPENPGAKGLSLLSHQEALRADVICSESLFFSL
jgi:hypothetical protein